MRRRVRIKIEERNEEVKGQEGGRRTWRVRRRRRPAQCGGECCLPEHFDCLHILLAL